MEAREFLLFELNVFKFWREEGADDLKFALFRVVIRNAFRPNSLDFF